MRQVEVPSLFRRPEFGLATLENMKWKTPGVVAAHASDTSAPRVVRIETPRHRGRIIGKWRRVCLVSDELRNGHGDARTGHQPDTGTSCMEHSNPGPMRSPVQLDGIFTGDQHQRPPANTPLEIRDHLLQSPRASAAFSPQPLTHGRDAGSCGTREDDPDFAVRKTQGFVRRRTDDGICTRSNSSGVITRRQAIRRRRSSSLRPDRNAAAPARGVSSRSSGGGRSCSSNHATRRAWTFFFRYSFQRCLTCGGRTLAGSRCSAHCLSRSSRSSSPTVSAKAFFHSLKPSSVRVGTIGPGFAASLARRAV